MATLTKYNENIPDWLNPYINKECPSCGAPLVDDGPEENGVIKLTQRWCPNNYCPAHMSHKIVALANYLNIPNIGPATAEAMVRLRGLKSHLEAIPHMTDGVKPEVYLWEVGIMAQLYGIANKWKELLLGYETFEDYFDKEPCVPYGVMVNKEYLIYAEKFFTLKKPLSKSVIKIMISGSIQGFSNKNDFVPWLNERLGQYIQVMDIGKRQNDVDYLVKEPFTADHSKTGIAIANGIPIVSSAEFVTILTNMIKGVE